MDDIIITDELGGVQFRKPCDIAFRIIQNKWRIPMSQIIYIADNTEKDFQAPQQLGMKSMWCQNEDGLYHSTVLTVADNIKGIDSITGILKGFI